MTPDDDALNRIERMIEGQSRMLAERLDRIERSLAERAPVQTEQPDDPVAALRASCAELGIVVTDGRIGEYDAAMLLGKSVQTLRNWRYGDRPLPYSKLGGRITYRLTDLAAFLNGERNDT